MIEEIRVQSDLLVVGGGVAGLNAALSAAAAGIKVFVADKANIEHSGNIAGGVDHFLAYLETGAQWDTQEAYLDFTANSSRGATVLDVVKQVYCEELTGAIQRMDDIGCTLRQPDGSFFRTQSYGQPGPYWINFNGKRMKPLLAQAVRAAGCTVLDRVVITDLLTGADGVCGAVGFHLREGTFYVIQAKAVLVSTGGTNRLYQNPTGLSFNTWMCPVNTGDGEAMALRAGAALANVEYLRMSVVPRGLSAAGLNAFVGMGGRIVNGLGEDFMTRYDQRGVQAPRYKLVEGVLGELKANRGPVYLDCRHLDPTALNHLVTTLGYDKDTLPDFIRQKGIDLSKDLLELNPSEGMQGGPTEVCGSGIKIDPDCSTALSGLYAAGNTADQCRSLHMAVTSGIRAGRTAGAYALAQTQLTPLSENQVIGYREQLYAPLIQSQGRISWQEFEDVLQRVITEGLGPVRTAAGLAKCREKLSLLTKQHSLLKANNYHELCRAHELRNLLTIAQAMTEAAEFRQESRFGQSHYRLDFPTTDDDNWLGQILVRMVDGEPETSFLSLNYKRGEDHAARD